jgi:membrane-associated phospholipid phosphatase
MLAPASLVPPPWRGPALAGAFVFAGATGLFRMAFGAHYLSDVCAAMLIMALLVLVLHRLILRPRHEGTRPSRT